MRLESVTFQRTKGGPHERGILVNEGDGPLLGANGQPVEAGACWDYRRDYQHVMTIPDTIEEPATTADPTGETRN